jgi:DNA polymerase-3 subunit beta
MNNAAELETKIDEETENAFSIDVIVDRNLFLKALGRVQNVVERRSTIAILSNVKLEAAVGELYLTTTDMDISIIERVDADIRKEGAITVPAQTLYEIIRKLPDGAQVLLKGDTNITGKMDIISGSCRFSLSCLKAADFPVIDAGDMKHEFTMTSAELGALIDKPSFAMSTEETRYYLNGIYLHSVNGMLCAVATDGHRLAKIELEAPGGAADIPGIIIPKKTVAEIKKIVDNSESDVEVALSDTKIYFASDKTVLLSKLIDGTFPDYNKVIPSNNDKSMIIDSAKFMHAVDRVSIISSDKSKVVKLSATSGKLTLSVTNDDSSTAVEEIDVDYDLADFSVGFNSRYVLDMMAQIEGQEVEFVFSDSAAPVLVKDASDEASLYVIMPVRI